VLQKFSAGATRTKLVLRPKQEQLLQSLGDHKSMTPQDIWDALGMTKQGAMKLMQPLPDAELVQRVGTCKVEFYILAQRPLDHLTIPT
jgi:DNA-binding MarR family transcriptional regulator